MYRSENFARETAVLGLVMKDYRRTLAMANAMHSQSDTELSSRAAWVVVNTHANQESIAERNLINRGYEVYAPVIRKQIRHARRSHDVLRPLFPCYLFARPNVREMRWRPILSTLGVRSVVRSGDSPSLLPERLVAELKAREKNGVIVRPASSRKIGETVRLARGPFDGFAGQIIELCERDRLIVLMNFLNQPVKVTVSEDQLSAY
jgi:transcriptional antiterminator RfaH